MNSEYKKLFDSDVKSVNRALVSCEYLNSSGFEAKKVLEAESYGLSAGGKRIRPVLCIEFYKLFGGKADISDIAVCLELIHTFSLIHDDMPEMDNDLVRRGKPSVHAAFGADIALLAGDGLTLLPFEIISRQALDGSISALTAVRLINCLSSAAGSRGMIMGQELDLMSEGKDVDTEFLKTMSSLKTGCLLKASAAFGAVLAEADEEKVKSAEEYAENLGLAFQIVDDILDVVGSEEELGKPIGSDKERNKNTFADILGVKRSYELAREYTEKAVSAIEKYSDSGFLCELARELVLRKK